MAWCTRVDFAVSRNRDCLSKQVTARRLHWGFTEIHRVPCAVSVVSLLMIYRRHSQVGQPWLTVSFIESWQPFLFLLFFFFIFSRFTSRFCREKWKVSVVMYQTWARVHIPSYRWVTPLPAFFEYTPRIRCILSITNDPPSQFVLSIVRDLSFVYHYLDEISRGESDEIQYKFPITIFN